MPSVSLDTPIGPLTVDAHDGAIVRVRWVADPSGELTPELHAAIDGRWAIFAMVRIADLLKVRSGTQKRQSWQNKINCKHIDFVICDPHNLEPVLAIELDDRSHQRADRIRRDEFVNDAFQAAELPLLRIRAAREYFADEILAELRDFLDLEPRQRKRTKRKRTSTRA